MKINRILFVLLADFILQLGFNSCQKEQCNRVKNYYYLNDADKKFIPYSGNDTLVFLKPNNDTLIVFQGHNIITYYEEYTESLDGCYPIDFLETKEYIYKARHNSFLRLTLKIQKNRFNETSIFVNLLNNEFKFYYHGDSVWSKYSETIIIEDKTYNNVYKCANQDKMNIYFSPKGGVIRYERADGDTGTISK